MSRTIGILASAGLLAGLAGGGLAGVASAAESGASADVGRSAAQECTLVQSEIYTGANLYAYSQGLEGCSGDVSWEILGSDSSGGPFEVFDSGTTHYDDEVVRHRPASSTMPCWSKIHAEFGDQEITTRVAMNTNCGG